MSFWDVVWFIIISFAFIAYLMILFRVITDLFRDRGTSGWVKAAWLILLIFLPLVTSLVYLIFRGTGMAEREGLATADLQARQDAYIREVAGQAATPAAEIAKAAEMRDHGQITEAEFDKIKEKALA